MEKKQLIKNGFKSWNRFNYRQFVRACANHGRDDVDSICKEMMLQGKKKEEVERYVNTKPKESEQSRIWKALQIDISIPPPLLQICFIVFVTYLLYSKIP